MKAPIDALGVPLEVGTLVIFNLSGEMALGMVESYSLHNRQAGFTRTKRYKMKIKVIKSRSHTAGHISTINSQFNCMTLTAPVYTGRQLDT